MKATRTVSENMANKYRYALLGVAALSVAGGIAIVGHHAPVCPDDFATEEEQLTAVDAWTNRFYDGHPGASLTEWAQARYEFWVANGCTAALQRYEDVKTGRADPATMERIQNGIQEAVSKPTSLAPKAKPAVVLPSATVAPSGSGGGRANGTSESYPATPLKCSNYTDYFASIPDCEYIKQNSSANEDGVEVEHPLYRLCKQCLAGSVPAS